MNCHKQLPKSCSLIVCKARGNERSRSPHLHPRAGGAVQKLRYGFMSLSAFPDYAISVLNVPKNI